MAAQIEWSNKAAEQLDEIVEYIANDSIFHASKTATRIVQATRSLGIFPERSAFAPELKDTKVREIHVFSYRILYRHLKNENKIRIVGIVHGMQLLDETMIEK